MYETMLRRILSIFICFQETMESVQTAMQGTIDQRNLGEGHLPGWDDFDDRHTIFNDTRKTLQGKLKRLSTDERNEVAARLRSFWPAAEAFASDHQSE